MFILKNISESIKGYYYFSFDKIMLSNINYRAHLINCKPHLFQFNKWKKPRQCVLKMKDFSLILFESGKCRIMGCKKPIMNDRITCNFLEIQIECIQSITVTCDLGQFINLYKLSCVLDDCCFEPELFPTLRINKYKPLCVNVFASGKVVILGLKSLEYHKTINDITKYILDKIV